jgi:catechol 2,3-dioxygenase-like lactoylglutathione lyase family enzyme
MRITSVSVSLAACAALLAGSAQFQPAAAEERDATTLHHVLWQPSMNVFRRYAVDTEEMYRFYGDVLGLAQLQTFDVGGGTNVARFMVGRSEVKLTRRVANRTYVPGGIEDATGLRLLTFFYPDRADVLARFREHGYEEPQFAAVPGTTRMSALVVDPDGHAVELVIAPDEPAETYATIEIGLTVSDLDSSRAFYRDFVGLEELTAVENRGSDTKKISYRHGTTIVSLHSVGRDLPADTGTGGIQYVVSDVVAVDELRKLRDVTVEQPLSGLAGFDLRTIWLADPDGITNYFAETGQSRGASAAVAQ